MRKKNEIYTQCLLYKFISNSGTLKRVAWIPESFANEGAVIKIQRDDGSWSDGWTVQERYSSHPEPFVLLHERDFARQRKASDI
jgi:hypothetical protein